MVYGELVIYIKISHNNNEKINPWLPAYFINLSTSY